MNNYIKNIKFYIGPMSKNIIDSIIEFCNVSNNEIGLIPSRRQIESSGGYVNNWTTKKFYDYVKSKTNRIILQRDHAGPNQGEVNDDGFDSLKEDCKYFDLIHIDPWKKYNDYKNGLKNTIDMIKYCYNINPKIQYEIGTEETIKYFNELELNNLIYDIKTELSDFIFNQIKYVVIQSGTGLIKNTQIGNYNKLRLVNMISVVKKYNLYSKEHNGDYISKSVINKKFELGLNSINIAPEFGLIETQTYLDNIKNNNILDLFWRICFNSNKWVKWVDKSYDPYKQKKEDLIKICGHYVLSNPVFLKNIKSHFYDIDEKIKINIKNKLTELYG